MAENDPDLDRVLVMFILDTFHYYRYSLDCDCNEAYRAVRRAIPGLQAVMNRATTSGVIPGVHVGDDFFYRVVLKLVGMHDDIVRGICSRSEGGAEVVTCLVAQFDRHNRRDENDNFIYGGETGYLSEANNRFHIRVLDHQRWTERNAALLNAIEQEDPIRLILGQRMEDNEFRYVYDGLYGVVDHQVVLSAEGFQVYVFTLERM